MEGDDPLVAQCRSRVGRLISGKWRLDALIGVGGMAAVYMATHRNGSMAAVKILHEEVSLNQEVRERFLREAYIANKVNHPGTVKVLDDDKDEQGAPYIVMELLRGETVEMRAQKAGGRLAIGDTLEILDQTLAVLEFAHAQTIVHRDLKPENLFMTDQGQLKVLDFGIARLREEKQARRTQTGLVMGTPAFMAPEQAMGRWNDVDARTDLWAMGATAFTLLTGLPVHDAETAGEMLIAAATRPARSLARMLNGAPFQLVALVDRALSYERENRFPDAVTFRAELQKIRASVTQDVAPVRDKLSPDRPIIPATVHGKELPAHLMGGALDAPDDDDKERIETFDPSSNSDAEIERMANFFSLLERAFTATKQYSAEHPEPKRRFDEAFRELAAALMTCDIALAWNLTPYSFGAREQPVWEPEAPWNRVPYQLFADGVRMMGFSPGLDQPEFMRWVKLVTMDPLADFAPEDDLVTLLWDANLEHVFFQAIDSFAEGNQDQRARYEADRANVVAGAHIDHRADLSKAVLSERDSGGGKKRPAAKGGGDAVEKSRELFRVLSRGDTNDAEAAARIANLNLMEESPDEAEAANTLKLDENTRALLAARLEVDVAGTSERFIVAAAEAFIVSAKMGRSAAVTAPLRRAVDSLGAGAPAKAVEMILELRDAVSVEDREAETESLRETMTSEVLSAGTLLEMLKGGDALQGDTKTDYLKAVSRVLGCLQPQHFDSALAYLENAPAGDLQQLLLAFIMRVGRGNEAKIATLFAKVNVDLGLALVRLLSEIDTDAAREAVGMASQSPHALVRIEALGHIEGASGSRLRLEMRKLLEDPDPDVRLLALRAMEDHNIAIAGPFLVLRIQESEFSKLPFEERRQGLQTLGKLRIKRCEEVCVTLLSESSILRTKSRDETRELAAQVLGEVASSDTALFLLEKVAQSSPFRNSKRVRDAASAALARLKARADEVAKRIAERKANPSVHEARKKKSGMGTSPNVAAPSGKSGAGMSGVESRMSAPAASKTGAGTAPAAGKTGAGKGTGADSRPKAPSVTSDAAPSSPKTGPAAQPANDNKPGTFNKTPSTGRVTKPVGGQEAPDGDSPSSKRARSQS
jgi:serine/threonine protein kinase